MPTAKQIKSRYKRNEIVKKIIKGLALAGAFYIAASSPYFALNLLRNLDKISLNNLNQKERKQIRDTFGYLRRQGAIKIKMVNNQIYISLTKHGKKLAKKYQIDELHIAKPKHWDGKWRLLLFDIPDKAKIKREALRGKLKELDFTMIQKSVWLHPYPCHNELEMLREFFGLSEKHFLFIETNFLGPMTENLKKRFKLN